MWLVNSVITRTLTNCYSYLYSPTGEDRGLLSKSDDNRLALLGAGKEKRKEYYVTMFGLPPYSWWFLTTAGVIVACGITAWYFYRKIPPIHPHRKGVVNLRSGLLMVLTAVYVVAAINMTVNLLSGGFMALIGRILTSDEIGMSLLFLIVVAGVVIAVGRKS